MAKSTPRTIGPLAPRIGASGNGRYIATSQIAPATSSQEWSHTPLPTGRLADDGSHALDPDFAYQDVEDGCGRVACPRPPQSFLQRREVEEWAKQERFLGMRRRQRLSSPMPAVSIQRHCIR